jgi:hypothetical protein
MEIVTGVTYKDCIFIKTNVKNIKCVVLCVFMREKIVKITLIV